MAVSLEDFDDALESRTRDLLGDTITYTPFGGAPITFKAIVDYSGTIDQLAGSKVAADDCVAEVPNSIVPVPTGQDIIDLPKRPGVRFMAKDWVPDETGMSWLILLKKKPS